MTTIDTDDLRALSAELAGNAALLVDAAADAIDEARRDVASLSRRWDVQADRWCVYHPEQGLEWMDTRDQAESFALDLMHDILARGEAHTEPAVVMAAVSHTEEVVTAEAGDGSDSGEWLRERGLDYLVSDYRIAVGPAAVWVDNPNRTDEGGEE